MIAATGEDLEERLLPRLADLKASWGPILRGTALDQTGFQGLAKNAEQRRRMQRNQRSGHGRKTGVIGMGGKAFAEIGIERNGGTRLFSVSGNVEHPGVYELPMGYSLRKLIYEVAGGIANHPGVAGGVGGDAPTGIGAGEEPVAVRIAPDGKTLAVANRKAGSVSLIDPANRKVRSVFDGCPGASDAVILPDSTKIFVACSAGHQIMAIALARTEAHPAAPAQSIAAQPDRLEALLDVGQAPVQLALKPDGGEVFVSNSLANSISEVYATTDEVGGATLMGDDPVRGLVSADNALLYVANFHSQYVGVYSIDDGKRIGSVHVGDGPAALAFSAAGHLLFVVDSRSSDIAVVRTVTRSLFTLLPAGRDPNAIAIKSFKLP